MVMYEKSYKGNEWIWIYIKSHYEKWNDMKNIYFFLMRDFFDEKYKINR